MSDKKPTIAEQARKAGIKPSVVHSRLHAGWSLEKALNTPARINKVKPRKQPSDDSSPSVDIQQQFRAVVEELEMVTNRLNTATQYNDALSAQIQIKNKQLSRMFMAVTGTTALAGLALLQLVL